jgi:hypothetical protein
MEIDLKYSQDSLFDKVFLKKILCHYLFYQSSSSGPSRTCCDRDFIFAGEVGELP